MNNRFVTHLVFTFLVLLCLPSTGFGTAEFPLLSRSHCLTLLEGVGQAEDSDTNGFLTNLSLLSPEQEHTIKNREGRLRSFFGEEVYDRLRDPNTSFFIGVGSHDEGTQAVAKEGWKLGKKIKNARTLFNIYEGTTPGGKKGYVFLDVYGKDTLLHSHALLKVAGVSGSRLTTVGRPHSFKEEYLTLFRNQGNKPDLVVFGWPGVLPYLAWKAYPLRNLKALGEIVVSYAEERTAKDRELPVGAHDLSQRKMSTLELQGGKRVWLLNFSWGDLSQDVFEALSEHGVRNVAFIGTAGSLRPDDHVGMVVTPKFQLLPDGRSIPADRLTPVKGIPHEGTSMSVSTPEIETEAWRQEVTKAGGGFVDVELAYLMRTLRNYPEIKARVVLVISDVVGKTELTQWDRNKAISVYPLLKPLFVDALDLHRPTDFLIRSVKSVPIVPTVEEALKNRAAIEMLGQWHLEPGSRPESQQFVDQILQFSPSQRVHLLSLIERGVVKLSGTSKNILQLLAYDKNAWEKYLEVAGTKGNEAKTLLTSLRSAVEKMPDELAESLWSKIRQLYPTAAHWFPELTPEERNKLLAPKRALDAFLRIRFPAEKIISEEMTNGKNVIEAYQRYFDRIQLPFKGTAYGRYTAEDTLSVMKVIQKWLQAQPRREGEAPSKITVFGSFVNGKANMGTSDVDIFVSSPEMKKYFPALNRAIQNQLGKKFPDVKLNVDIPPVSPQYFTEVRAGSVNPVLFEITPDVVSLVLYQPVGRNDEPLHLDRPLRTVIPVAEAPP